MCSHEIRLSHRLGLVCSFDDRGGCAGFAAVDGLVTPAQELLIIHMKELGFKEIEVEYRFNASRRWKADIAIPSCRLLLECDGGMFHGGHKRGKALEDDYERQNWAQMSGWRILRFSNRQVLTGEAKSWLAKWMLA